MKEIAPILNAWADAVATRSPQNVVALYDEQESSLWGTLALEPLFGRENISTYFDSFLDCESISVEWLDVYKRTISKSVRILSGSYEFTICGRNGAPASEKAVIPARFTFVIRRTENEPGWIIVDHHSSQFPDVAPQRVKEELQEAIA